MTPNQKSAKDMNVGLFTDENKIKEEIRKAFCKLDLDTVLQNQEKLSSQSQTSEQLSKEIKATFDLKNKISQIPADSVLPMVKLFLEYESTREQDCLLPRQAILEGVSMELISRLGDSYWDFINGADNVHPAEFFIHTKNYDALLDACQHYLIEKGEHALIRQLISFYYFKTEKYDQAPIHLSLAVFLDPFGLKSGYISNLKIKSWIEGLHKSESVLFEEYLEDFLKLWHDQQIQVPYYDSIIKHLEDSLKSFQPTTLNHRQKLTAFLNHFYLAEIYRQQDSIPESIIDIRQNMKFLYAEIYTLYFSLITQK